MQLFNLQNIMVNPLNSKYNNQAPIPIGKGGYLLTGSELGTQNSNLKFLSYYSQHYSNSDLLFKFAATIQIRDMNSARALTGSGSTTLLFKASVAFNLKYFMHAG